MRSSSKLSHESLPEKIEAGEEAFEMLGRGLHGSGSRDLTRLGH